MRIILCDYGCGNEAKYQFKNGKRCCCSHSNKCSKFRDKYKGSRNPFFRKHHNNETKKLWKITRKGICSGSKNGMFGRCGEKNPFFGKTHSFEQKRKWKKERNSIKYKKEMSGIMEKLWKEQWFIDSHRRYTDEELGELSCYYRDVWRYTGRSIRKYIQLINPENKKLGYRFGHIDHIYSIHMGFKNNINPKIIGSYINLQILSLKNNLSKNKKCDITLSELKERYENNIRS